MFEFERVRCRQTRTRAVWVWVWVWNEARRCPVVVFERSADHVVRIWTARAKRTRPSQRAPSYRSAVCSGQLFFHGLIKIEPSSSARARARARVCVCVQAAMFRPSALKLVKPSGGGANGEEEDEED